MRMLGFLVVAPAILVLGVAPEAEAAVNTASAYQIAVAMEVPAEDLVSADLGESDPNGAGVSNSFLGNYFPTNGDTFAILASGNIAIAPTPNNSGSGGSILEGLNTSTGKDLVQLTLVLAPPEDATCIVIDFAFYSEEFPEFVGSSINDAFLAEHLEEIEESEIAIELAVEDGAQNVHR